MNTLISRPSRWAAGPTTPGLGDPPMRRLLPRRHWNDEGVASTVGTIMALLVFLTFLSHITNQYVPVWMKDSEAGHMGEVHGQIGKNKRDIYHTILGAQTAVH